MECTSHSTRKQYISLKMMKMLDLLTGNCHTEHVCGKNNYTCDRMIKSIYIICYGYINYFQWTTHGNAWVLCTVTFHLGTTCGCRFYSNNTLWNALCNHNTDLMYILPPQPMKNYYFSNYNQFLVTIKAW